MSDEIREARIRFRSLLSPELTYTLYGDSYALSSESRKSYRPIAPWAGCYQNYGDGDVQHSTEWAVQDEYLADYCYSLAVYLNANPEHVPVLAKHWPSATDVRLIRFLATVRYKAPPEGKWSNRRYYSKNEMKVSAAENKKHDKRWEEVPEWADGSIESVWRMLDAYNGGLFDSYVKLGKIKELFVNDREMFTRGLNVGEYLKIKNDDVTSRAIDVLEDMVESHQRAVAARRNVEVLNSHVSWKREEEAKKAAAKRAEEAKERERIVAERAAAEEAERAEAEAVTATVELV